MEAISCGVKGRSEISSTLEVGEDSNELGEVALGRGRVRVQAIMDLDADLQEPDEDTSTGKVGDRKSVENDKSFDFSLLYNSDFVNFVKNDNKLNLSSVSFVTFDRHDI